MTQEKVEQNALIVQLREKKGYTWQQILDELNTRGLSGLSSKDSVKMKYYAVKRRQPSGKVTSTSTSMVTQEAPKKEQVTSPVTSTPTSTSTRRMTFWLPKEMIRELKSRSVRERRTASDILREVLGKYLKNK